MVANYYTRNNFSQEQLAEIMQGLEENLRDVGALFNGEVFATSELNEYQLTSRQLNNEGYDFGEQIHDLYSEMGAVIEAQEA